ncbi:NAD(P)/FAD-dependent oxidoreductase [Natronoglycomyces albus]|uniref:NAD(P)/FAD-dependent oxidoreductase n=1 Tax=Natronoglycomyces albus TaxID=2811108 RepID=A0A895XUP6_9ACTN|nr:NAD(P)/FAD-dependent oxidoreductase [Natronoglycomyces albus]QSB05950.1 NAD(P)/FAD-dependent oxidoreductase [Natronoglycomyces albus]
MKRIVVIGAGHVGFYVADRLSRKLKSEIRRRQVEVMVIEPNQHMTYQPFLPEMAAGHISPRHGVVPLRRALKRCNILTGLVTEVRHAEKTLTVQPISGPSREVEYDQVVVAPGSVSRTFPIPGLAELAMGNKTIGEAIWLRNHVLQRLDVAAATPDEATRKAALTFVTVGGGFAGIETLAELEDTVRAALKAYPEIDPDEVRWVLVEATQRILPEVGPEMGVYAAKHLVKRGVDLRLNTQLKSCVDGHVVLSDGEEFDTQTMIWTAGVKPHPMLKKTDLPQGPRGHLRCSPTLQVEDDNGIVEGAWGAGDSAQVPDLSGFAQWCSPSAQHAVRQAGVLADNIVATIRGTVIKEYKHKYIGSVAGLGLYKGVANTYGVKVKGLMAWMMHRAYHLSRVPGIGRKGRILSDWILGLFTKREIVQLGEMHNPRDAWEALASGEERNSTS